MYNKIENRIIEIIPQNYSYFYLKNIQKLSGDYPRDIKQINIRYRERSIIGANYCCGNSSRGKN